jgi:hypothetical protein
MSFVLATLLSRRSLPRSVRAMCWLMLVGDRLAPEVAKD